MVPKVLVIARESLLAHPLTRTLGKAFELTSAPSCARGIQCLDEASPQLVLLDSLLPHSHECCRQLRDMADIPVILLGMESEEKSYELAVEIGADAYLVFTTQPQEVVAMVRAVLRRYQAVGIRG